jgi:hypothetical protein
VPSAPCDPSIGNLVSNKLSNRSAPGAGAPSAGATTLADALFASALQRSDRPTRRQVQQATAAAIATYGSSGCAARVAQAFGEHPETATTRMRWARALTACAIPATFLAA